MTQHNNVRRYCDPANNPNNAWNPDPGAEPCLASGSTHYAHFTYSSDTGEQSDANEPYGCLTEAFSPSGYRTAVTYAGTSGVCGFGLPTRTQGNTYIQANAKPRTPRQLFGYDESGNLISYDPGNGAWSLGYSTNGMKRLLSRTDPDGVTSFWCYNPDGSMLYSATALQNFLDNGSNHPSCPSDAQIISGSWTSPLYASLNRYDADGDVATVLSHHNCTITNCAANLPATTSCNETSVHAGTTCNFYDGLDRLVEVKQPFDAANDVYVNPWITRYRYDLTGDPVSFGDQSFRAHGNLYKTLELLAPGDSLVTLTTPKTPGEPSPAENTVYQEVKATAFDALDRTIAKYSEVFGHGLSIERLTWDSSPLNADIAGLLGEDCNGLTPTPQCQEFDYRPGGLEKTFVSSDKSAPRRTYLYDPDGRPTQITEAGFSNAQDYSYDHDGRTVTSADANASRATLTHGYYPDGKEKNLDVASAALSQAGLFTYSYREDGRTELEVVNDSSLQGSPTLFGTTRLLYRYTAAGRMLSRSEDGVGSNPTPTSLMYDLPSNRSPKIRDGSRK